ncbi:MAG: L-rhamnose mutarotase, partial [Lentisphaeria bacterium]|nr:L-rhamnose mutarotase [Lentisphaeria bacterium]
MIRKAFYMEVRPGHLAEYTHVHNPIPEELKAILKRHGVNNYSIFHHP